MSPVACFAGIIVRDLARSVAWYTDILRCPVPESGSGWACLELEGGSRVELTEGDPEQPGLTFPSYGREPGPPVLPGYSVEDPDELAATLTVVRRLPDWIVVVTPDRTRLVLTSCDREPDLGLVAFRWFSPQPERQSAFLADLGVTAPVDPHPAAAVIPVVAADRTVVLHDPDGTPVHLTARRAA